jgi:protein-S-isoprenylcysteine O-methyltransferase Ste14
MGRAFLETIFLGGVALLFLLEIFYFQNFSFDRKILGIQKKKRFFLLLLLTGIQLFPFVYIFSVDFGSTDYHIWNWISIPVLFVFVFCLWLFGKALYDLGRWWTPGQELKEDLELVRNGTYFYVRHPMYLALAGISICQVFMIQNWIAGPVSLIFATPFLIYQIRREESMLIKYFGEDYKNYVRETGMIWPRGDRMPFLRKVVRTLFVHLKKMLLGLWKILRKNLKRKR